MTRWSCLRPNNGSHCPKGSAQAELLYSHLDRICLFCGCSNNLQEGTVALQEQGWRALLSSVRSQTFYSVMSQLYFRLPFHRLPAGLVQSTQSGFQYLRLHLRNLTHCVLTQAGKPLDQTVGAKIYGQPYVRKYMASRTCMSVYMRYFIEFIILLLYTVWVNSGNIAICTVCSHVCLQPLTALNNANVNSQ